MYSFPRPATHKLGGLGKKMVSQLWRLGVQNQSVIMAMLPLIPVWEGLFLASSSFCTLRHP